MTTDPRRTAAVRDANRIVDAAQRLLAQYATLATMQDTAKQAAPERVGGRTTVMGYSLDGTAGAEVREFLGDVRRAIYDTERTLTAQAVAVEALVDRMSALLHAGPGAVLTRGTWLNQSQQFECFHVNVERENGRPGKSCPDEHAHLLRLKDERVKTGDPGSYPVRKADQRRPPRMGSR